MRDCGVQSVGWTAETLKRLLKRPRQCGANLARLMSNIGGPREEKRRLVERVVHSKLLYAAPVWVSVLDNHAIQKSLSSTKRCAVMGSISAYRTVSTSAVLVLASVRSIDLLAKERQARYCIGFFGKPIRGP